MIMFPPNGAALGTQPAMLRALKKVGLNVPEVIRASADENHAIDALVALGVRYQIWQVDAALAKTNLNMTGKMHFKSRLAEVGLLASKDEDVQPGPRFTTASEIMARLKRQYES